MLPQWFFALILNAQRRLIRTAGEKSLAIGKHIEPVRIVQRDKSTGFWRVLPEVKVQFGSLLDLPNYNPRRRMHAFDPSFSSGRPRHCGRRGLIDLLESGIDTTRQELRQCEADLEDSRRSDMRVNQIVREVTARRKQAI
jgi:hypothetical protein